ncbi:MAG: outer membrane beta-barrel protein [Chthoniobacter sp.]|nr:outer membrane beta-barrel protein [Chthoniobacter sp.]
MKKLIALVPCVIGLLAVCSQAGQPIVSDGKDTKEYKQLPPEEPCFKEHEWQVDLFGQYSVGEGPNQAGVMRDHGFGGGIGINYFFTRNIGLGVDASWLDIKESPGQHHVVDTKDTALHNFTGSAIFRFPIPSTCLAPYIYAGGGFEVDGQQWASAHGGVGLEYRIVPHKIGLFVDGRWTYLGDRNDQKDLNFFSTRAGVRIVF